MSAGIDMALALTERVHGRELAESLQLAIEYDPQPPFDSGSPAKADASTLRLALRVLLGDRPVQTATRLNRQSAAARLGRARRALHERVPNKRRPAQRAKNYDTGTAIAIAEVPAIAPSRRSRLPERLRRGEGFSVQLLPASRDENTRRRGGCGSSSPK